MEQFLRGEDVPRPLAAPYRLEGNINLENTDAEMLAQRSHVIVTGSLRIHNSLLTKLPKTLEVGGNLIIDNCPMLCDLPESLRLQGQLFVTKVRTSLYAQAVHLETQQLIRRVILI